MSHKIFILVAALFLFSSCRSTTPSPADFSERVQELVREAEELSKEGTYFPPDPRDRKKLVEDAANLLLDKVELELRYSGLSDYPEADGNAKEYLRLVTCLINAPRRMINKECSWSWDESLFFSREVADFFWRRDVPEKIFWFTVTGIPWGVYVGGQVGSFILDLFSFPKAINTDHRTLPEFELNPQLVARHKALESQVASGRPSSQPQETAESDKLIVTFTYALEGEPHEIERWKLMIERGIVAGSKNTGVVFNHIEEDFYERAFHEVRKEMKEELTRRSGKLLGSNVKYFNHTDQKLVVVAKLAVAIAPEQQNGFISFARKKNGQWDGVVVDVEIPRPGIEEDEALHKSLIRTYGDRD